MGVIALTGRTSTLYRPNPVHIVKIPSGRG